MDLKDIWDFKEFQMIFMNFYGSSVILRAFKGFQGILRDFEGL